MSVVPTDSLLYVAILVPDQSLLRSIAKNGLIVWVDPAGKRAHTYGIQYPIALRAQRAAQKSTSSSGDGGAASALNQMLPSDLALIRNDTIRRRVPPQLASGLQVQATLETGSLIYELAIPVSDRRRGDVALSLRGPLAQSISVGIETPNAEDDSEGLDGRRGIPSVTGRGRRGRTPRGRRRRGRRGRQMPAIQQSEGLPTLNMWTQVVGVPQ